MEGLLSMGLPRIASLLGTLVTSSRQKEGLKIQQWTERKKYYIILITKQKPCSKAGTKNTK